MAENLALSFGASNQNHDGDLYMKRLPTTHQIAAGWLTLATASLGAPAGMKSPYQLAAS